jgi:hypothetical protein
MTYPENSATARPGRAPQKAPLWAKTLAIVAVLFGVATVFSGGSVVFGVGQAQQAAGNYMPFVVWFNFLAGFAYVVAGVGLFFWRRWAIALSAIIAAATLLVFAAFGLQALSGMDYEPRTIGAMVLRSSLWLAIAFFARASLKRQGRP